MQVANIKIIGRSKTIDQNRIPGIQQFVFGFFLAVLGGREDEFVHGPLLFFLTIPVLVLTIMAFINDIWYDVTIGGRIAIFDTSEGSLDSGTIGRNNCNLEDCYFE
jgi:hypothetical protein